jgi:aminoglycoside phosphotransferase (APT) family kinase protein
VAETQDARRERALRSARKAVRGLGLDDAGACVLRDAHNTLVLLPGPGVVAKVATSTLAARGPEALARELAIGRHLAARRAPIAPPLAGSAGGPHELDGTVLTLWSYRAAGPAPGSAAPRLGTALAALHDALADLGAPLPAFTEKLDRAAALFADPGATPELQASDRHLTALAHERLRPRLAGVGDRRPLHGEPHEGNVLWTPDGPLFVDFEGACSGPREWDLAYLPPEARAAFPDRDDELVEVLGRAIAFCVAAWCWAQRGRAPEVDEAAAHHLGVLRSTFGRG